MTTTSCGISLIVGIGSLEGRPFKIKRAAKSDGLIQCYKKFPISVLMTVADAYKMFTWVSIGDYGKFLYLCCSYIFTN